MSLRYITCTKVYKTTYRRQQNVCFFKKSLEKFCWKKQNDYLCPYVIHYYYSRMRACI